MSIPVLLLINKIDESDQKETLVTLQQKWHALLPNADFTYFGKISFKQIFVEENQRTSARITQVTLIKNNWTDKPAKFFCK